MSIERMQHVRKEFPYGSTIEGRWRCGIDFTTEHCATETAVREVFEETGKGARIDRALGIISIALKSDIVTVQFYLMEANACGRPQESSGLLRLAGEALSHRAAQDEGLHSVSG